MKKFTLLACAFIAGLTFQANAQSEIVLSQNTDEVWTPNGVSCPGGDNWWMRSYDLSDYSLNGDVWVKGMEFSIQNMDFPEEFELYAFEYAGFPTGFDILNPPAPIAVAYHEIDFTDMGVKVRVDFETPYQTTSSSTIVVAVVQPFISGNAVFLGTTGAETKSSYLAAENCGIQEPDTVANVGFPDAMHFLNLVVDGVISTNDVLAQGTSIYPNPTTDVFNVTLPANVEVTSSSLVDMLGRTTGAVYSNGQIDASSLAKGVYILTLETNSGTYTQKVIKQ